MARIEFERLPDDARIWTFGTSRPLAPDERERLLGEVDRFLDEWRAHGTPLRAARSWRRDRFVVVGVDESEAPPSGCSIDALVHALEALEAELDVTLVDNAAVWYLEGDEVRRADRPRFRALAEAGEVGPETVVVDPTVTRMEELRAGRWERAAGDGWHRRAFFRDRAPA